MKAIVTVIGQDHVGIIAEVCALLSANNINIEDISQTVLQDYFTMIMMVDVPEKTPDFDALRQQLNEKGAQLGLSIRIQREDIFRAMHRI